MVSPLVRNTSRACEIQLRSRHRPKSSQYQNLGTGFMQHGSPIFDIRHTIVQRKPFPKLTLLGMAENSDPDSRISVTTGAIEGLLSSIMGFVDPGDEVIPYGTSLSTRRPRKAWTIHLLAHEIRRPVYFVSLGGWACSLYILIHPPSRSRLSYNLGRWMDFGYPGIGGCQALGRQWRLFRELAGLQIH